MRNSIKETLAKYSIPRSTVAKIAGLHLTDLSGWLNGRIELDPSKIDRITNTVGRIQTLVDVSIFSADLRDVESVKKSLTLLESICHEEFDRDFNALTAVEKLQARQALLNGIASQIKLNRVIEEATKASALNEPELSRIAAETAEYAAQAERGLAQFSKVNRRRFR
jgi:hypothetical protein